MTYYVLPAADRLRDFSTLSGTAWAFGLLNPVPLTAKLLTFAAEPRVVGRELGMILSMLVVQLCFRYILPIDPRIS